MKGRVEGREEGKKAGREKGREGGKKKEREGERKEVWVQVRLTAVKSPGFSTHCQCKIQCIKCIFMF